MLPFRTVHLFSLTLFLSATLAFVVQPMIAKLLLPMLGGAPAVWNTSLRLFSGHPSFSDMRLSDRLVRLGASSAGYWPPDVVDPCLLGGGPVWVAGRRLREPAPRALADRLAPGCSDDDGWCAVSRVVGELDAAAALVCLSQAATEDPVLLIPGEQFENLLGLLAFPFVFEPFLGSACANGPVADGGWVSRWSFLVASCARRVW